MKYALCLSGELRTFQYTAPSIKKILPDADIYLHTWSTSKDSWKNEKLGIDIVEYKTNINDIINTYGKQLKDVIIEDFFPTEKFVEGFYYKNIFVQLPQGVNKNKKRWFDQLYGMYKADIMRRESNITYDIIIRSRPDVMLLNKPFIDTPGIYQTRNPGYNQSLKANDFFAWGDELSMEIYTSMFEDATHIYKKCMESLGKLTGPEVLLQEYLNDNGVPTIDSKVKCGEILRNETTLENHMKAYYGDK